MAIGRSVLGGRGAFKVESDTGFIIQYRPNRQVVFKIVRRKTGRTAVPAKRKDLKRFLRDKAKLSTGEMTKRQFDYKWMIGS